MPRGKPQKSTLDTSSKLITDFIEKKENELSGVQRFYRAKKDWSESLREEMEDYTIENLLEDKDFLGSFNIWPSVKESLSYIWHRRYDFNVTFKRINKETGLEETLQDVYIYALNHPHAIRKARRQYPTLDDNASSITAIKIDPIHTVVFEMPRGTGKDFEMSLMVVLLVRDLLMQKQEEFYSFYDLDPGTRISVNLMNRTEPLAKRVTFAEVLPKFNNNFFLDYFPPANIDIEKLLDEKEQPSELRFPKNIIVFPGTGATSSNLGYALAALVMDECNNMPKNISSSRTISGQTETTGDAGEDIYIDGILRLQSRLGQFVDGKMDIWGMVIALSQSRTTMDFTKRRQQESLLNKEILYRNFPFWERKPLNLSGKTFEFDVRTLRVLNTEQAEKSFLTLRSTPNDLKQEG